MSEETFDVQAAIEGMARVEEFNDRFRQPNPNGRYPICRPKLYDAEHCEWCGSWIKGVDGPCPAVAPDKRWGENCEGVRLGNRRMNCQCGHARSQHGERFAGSGRVRTLALGCKVSGCGCEQYNEKDSSAATKRDTMTPDEVAAEVKQIRRIIHGLDNRLEKLDDALNTN